MLPTKDKYPENIVNPNFQKLLDKFHALIEKNPSPNATRSDLEALKKESNVIILTGHQRDSIHARVNNFLEGTYGSTSRPYDVHNHVKSSK